MKAVRQTHQIAHDRRIRCILICVFSFALGILLLWSVYLWFLRRCGVFKKHWKIKEAKLEQTGVAECVEETAQTQVESVNEQEKEMPQIGEAEVRVESVKEQEDKLEQIGEDEGVKETVHVHEGLQGEDSGMKAGTYLHQGEYNRRIRCIVICVLLCTLGMLLLWGVCRWGVFMNHWQIKVKIRLPCWLNPRVVYSCLLGRR
jgi:uncharacterized membrane protein